MNYSRTCAVLVSIVLVLLVSGCGITAPRSNEGYADLDSLGFSDTDSTVSLSFGPSALRLAAGFIDDDPETSELLLNLAGVRVKVYEIVRGQERVAQRIDKMSAKLRRQGWEPVLTVQEEDERTQVLVKMNGPDIVGLTVIALDEHEAVFVNVMGNLSPELFTETMVALEVDVPEVQVASAE
jgi:hypothetical protein